MPCLTHLYHGSVDDCLRCKTTCHLNGCGKNNSGYKYCSKHCRKKAQRELTKCTCVWCVYWKKLGVTGGVAIVILQKDRKEVSSLICLESSGKYKGKYNITTGKIEPIDNGCRINTCCRELFEELNILLTPRKLIEKIKLTWRHDDTAVVVLEFDRINLVRKNREIQLRNNTRWLPKTYKEIQKVSYVDIKTMVSPECNIEYTDYARDILKKLNEEFVYNLGSNIYE